MSCHDCWFDFDGFLQDIFEDEKNKEIVFLSPFSFSVLNSVLNKIHFSWSKQQRNRSEQDYFEDFEDLPKVDFDFQYEILNKRV